MSDSETLVEFDGTKLKDIKDVHQELAKQAKLPIVYGENLDALNDVLTGMIGRPLTIRWLNADESFRRFPQAMLAFEDVIEHVIAEELTGPSSWPPITYERIGGPQ